MGTITLVADYNLKKDTQLKVLLVEESTSTASASVLQKTLTTEGYTVLACINQSENILKKASEIDPDLIVVNVGLPAETLLMQVKIINETYPKPIIIFSESGENNIINSAVQAGVSAFIVDGLSEKRIQPVLKVALARFNNYTNMRRELETSKENLANRKVIEKAKGLIMKQRSCSEDEAYNMLRKMAMDKNQKIHEVAKNVIELSSLLM